MQVWGLRFACLMAVAGVIVILIRFPGVPRSVWREPAEAVQVASGVVTMLRVNGDGINPDCDIYAATVRLEDGREVEVDSASWCYWLWQHGKPGDRVRILYRDVGWWSPDIVVEHIEHATASD